MRFYEAADKRSKAKWRKYVYTWRICCLPIGLKRIRRGRKGCGRAFCRCLDFQLIVDRRSSPFEDLFPPKKYRVSALWIFFSVVRGWQWVSGNFRSPLEWITRGKRDMRPWLGLKNFYSNTVKTSYTISCLLDGWILNDLNLFIHNDSVKGGDIWKMYMCQTMWNKAGIFRNICIYIYVSICNLHVWIYESKEETSRDTCYEKRK